MLLTHKLDLYAFLARFRLLKTSYIAKVMVVAFLGTHVPLLTLFLTFVVSNSYSWEIAVRVLVIALVATLVGTGATLYALNRLLMPVVLTSAGLQDYLNTKTLPDLPTEFVDEAGTLMANTSQTLHKLDELIHYIRNYDDLTGLPNRELFGDRLSQTLSQPQNQQRLVAILLVGIDDFTGMSHAWQPQTSDLLLRAVAQRLTVSLNSTDILAYFSQDKFAIALTELPSLESVIKLSQLLLSTLAKPFAVENELIHITASVGITINEVEERHGIAQLLQQADIALYRAKQQGRSQYQFYSPEITAQLQERLALENELYGALERQEMRVHY